VHVEHFENYLNASGPYLRATLQKVTFHKNYAAGSIPFPYTQLSPEKYAFTIDGVGANLTPNAQVGSDLSLVLQPASLPMDQNSIIDIKFTFREAGLEPPHTDISGMYLYSYANVTRPALTNGVLEVAVW
jgi:hypothetical protein